MNISVLNKIKMSIMLLQKIKKYECNFIENVIEMYLFV